MLRESENILQSDRSQALYEEFPEYALAYTRRNDDDPAKLKGFTLQDAVHYHGMVRCGVRYSSDGKADMLAVRGYYTRFFITKGGIDCAEVDFFTRVISAILLSEPMRELLIFKADIDRAYSVWCHSASKRAVGSDPPDSLLTQGDIM